MKFVRDECDRASLENTASGRIGGETIPIGPIELQIAYKLQLGSQKTSKTRSTFTRCSRKTLVSRDSKHGYRDSTSKPNMSDSNVRDDLDAKHEQNREQRLEAVKRWVEYIKSEPPEKWGPQQNAVVDDQLDAAQHVGTSASHQQHVQDVAAEIAELEAEAEAEDKDDE